MDSITVGGRTILLPPPEESCLRYDEVGKLIVPWSLRRRMIAFFISDQEPVGKRYCYVQCMRFSERMNKTIARFPEIKSSLFQRYKTRTTMLDKTPESLCYLTRLKNIILGECMMLVAGRVLYLYAMCHEDDPGGALWAQTRITNWRDAVLKTNESSAKQ